MASNSRVDGGLSRMKNACKALYDDNQHLIGDLRKFMSTMKEIAIDLEKAKQHDKVKALENSLLELIEASEASTHLSAAIDSIRTNYQPGEELTDFEKLLEEEIGRFKASSSNFNPQNHSAMRQFREAIWNVHHGGQPMPGDDQEDIVMTSTESNLLNITCPLSGKPVVDIEEPVRSTECKHIYEKAAVMHYIKTQKQNARCPIAGCPRKLQADRVVRDPLLLMDNGRPVLTLVLFEQVHETCLRDLLLDRVLLKQLKQSKPAQSYPLQSNHNASRVSSTMELLRKFTEPQRLESLINN